MRTEYLDTKGLPESVIPFALTEDEARRRLAEWCDKNKGRPEAKKLRDLLPQLKGFYLPYELVRGPVHTKVARMDGGSTYRCEGFMNDEFINRSRQLDNLLLDGMEPFDRRDPDELQVFHQEVNHKGDEDIYDMGKKDPAGETKDRGIAGLLHSSSEHGVPPGFMIPSVYHIRLQNSKNVI